MEYNILGRTNLPVSKIGLGTWAYGNNVYGGVSELDSINAIHHAFHNGINLFDTAPQYGTKIQDGVAEIVLGKALKGIRKDVIIQTKFGRNPTIKDGSSQFNKERILASVDESLMRLQTDYIDVLFFHSPFYADEILDDVWEGINEVVTSGKVRFIGHSISNFHKTEQMARQWALDNKIDVVQVVFSLLNRESESLIKDLSQYPVGIVARECLANGFLSGSINRETVFANGTLNSRYTIDEIAERIDQVAKFEFLIDGDIRNMAQAALRAVIDQTGVNTVLSGAKNKKEIDDALTAANANPFSSQDLMTARALLTKNFEAA